MTYLNNNYRIVKFEKGQENKVSDKYGIYRVVALPISFNTDNQDLIVEYLDFCKSLSLNEWDKKINSKLSLKDNNINIELCKNLKTNILAKVDVTDSEDFFHKIKYIAHFLPSLYVGQVKDQSFKIRFIQHLNEIKEDSLINRINKIDIFKKSYKLFIFTEVDKEYIDFLESFLIQTTNPIFNRQRS